jgi:PPP5 TPR repeat region
LLFVLYDFTSFFLLLVAVIFFVCFTFDLTEVDAQYTGARIEGDTVTLDFVKHMMEDFKKQKCIHKRYIGNLLLIILVRINFDRCSAVGAFQN